MNSQNPLFEWLFGKVVPLLDFMLFEVLLTKRSILTLFVSALGYAGVQLSAPLLGGFGIPSDLWGWPLESLVFLVMMAGLLNVFAVRKWNRYTQGPRNAIHDVIFIGFFDPSGPEGAFVRTGTSKDLETEFLRTFKQALGGHRINSGMQIERKGERVDLPLKVTDYRPPRGLHAVHDLESYGRLARDFSSRCIGVVWGTIGEGGVDRFEITVDPSRYHGGALVEPLLRRVGQAVEQQGLPPLAVVRYVARVLAATWAYSHCQMLNDLDRNRDSLTVAADSRRLIEAALENLEKEGGPEAAALVEAQRRTLLPLVLRQEAWSLLRDRQIKRALERLHEALKVDLYSPLEDVRAYKDYYNHHYAFEVQEREKGFAQWMDERPDELPEWLKGLVDDVPGSPGDRGEPNLTHAGRALVGFPVPNLPLFVNWLELALAAGSNVSKLIDGWFSELAEAHPNNPFVLVAWGDVLKLQAGPRAQWHEEHRLASVDEAIKKYESAYTLDPTLSVLAARLWVLYIATAAYGKSAVKWRRGRADLWEVKAQQYYEEYLPSMLASDTTEEDALAE